MNYEKKICVLKQIRQGFSADGSALSGVVHAERLGNELTLTIKAVGLAPLKDGNYRIAIWVDGRYFCAELLEGGAVSVKNISSLRSGFAVLICFVRGEVRPVAFGTCGNAPGSYLDLMSVFEAADRERSEKKERAFSQTVLKKEPDEEQGDTDEVQPDPDGQRPIVIPVPPNLPPSAPSPNVPLAPGVPLPSKKTYDDEAIAESDYFRAFQNGQPNEDDEALCGGREEAGEAGTMSLEDAPDFLYVRGKLTYYLSIRDDVRSAFENGKRSETLLSVFPCSEWVEINGALLGVVYENGFPIYLCVAVEKEALIPEGRREDFLFVPTPLIEGKDGYFIVFQSADSGEVVRTSLA